MVLLHAVEGVLSLLLIGLAGYLTARKGWVGPETKAALPRIITYVALPPFLLYSLVSTFDKEELLHLIYGAIVPLVAMLFCFAVSCALVKLIRVREGRRGLFRAAFSSSNTVFIGIPVNLALFGDAALPYALLYYFANTLFFWTIGNYCISADSGKEKVRLCSVDTVRKVLSAPMLAFFLAIFLILLEVRLPEFLANTARYLGNMTTPLAIMLIGAILYEMDLRKIRLHKDLVWVLIGRFVVSPLSIWLVTLVWPLPELMYKVFFIQASLPAMMQIVVMSGFYKTDTEYAAVVVSVTTLAALVTIPIYMLVLS